MRAFGLGRFRSRAHFFLQTIMTFLQRREIGQHQFGIDHLDIANRIDRSADVMDVAALETTHDLHDRVDFADVTEKLVAEAFTRARAFHETGDIDELDRGRNNFLRVRQFRKVFQSRIGHSDDAEIRIDRAKRIIFRRRFVRARDGIKERGFPDIGQTDNSSAQHKARTLMRESDSIAIRRKLGLAGFEPTTS